VGLLVALLAGACVATYWSSLQGALISDDLVSIVRSEQVRTLSLANLLPEADTSFAGRPVVQLSFALNYALGGLDVTGYHVVNILIHVCCALVLFGIVRRTFTSRHLDERFGPAATDLGSAVALVWAVHPLNTDAVTYLSQRTESLMGLFYLLTVYACVRALSSAKKMRWQSAAVLSCALGMACKESMVTAPVAVFLYDRVYVFDSLREMLRARGRLYLALAATWLVVAALLMTGSRGQGSEFSGDVTPWTYLMNQAVMIVQYLRLAVWPHALVIDYGWALPFSVREVWPSAVLVVGLLMLTVVMLIRKPLAGFLGAWFFLTLAPTSSVVPIPSEVGRECRMYLPLIGLVSLAIVATVASWQRLTRWRTVRLSVSPRSIGLISLAIVAGALAAATISRNREYGTPLELFRTMVERWPTPRTHQIYAVMLLDAGRRDEAMPHLRAASDAVPLARHDLGLALFLDGKYDAAIEELRKMLEMSEVPPESHPPWQQPVRMHVVSAYTTIGAALARQGRLPEAIVEYRRALAVEPDHADALGNLADALLAQGSLEEASVRYGEYLKLRPSNADAATNWGMTLLRLGRLDEAIEAFRRASTVDPRQARNLANALYDKGDIDQAVAAARRAVAALPDDAHAHDVLGRSLAAQGHVAEAVVHFERALTIDPAHEDARKHLAQAVQTKGRREPALRR
jgi:tetratricopeptide (TPR) repeat protein